MNPPKSVKRSANDSLVLTWSDGSTTEIPIKFLRDECPCASCKGESGLFGVYYAPPEVEILPGRYDLKAAVPVGNYALQLEWGDGHDTGVYSWEFFRQLEGKMKSGGN